MTTTLSAPVPPFAVVLRRPEETPTAPLVHRSLRAGAHLLADALDGVARDDRCTPERQRALVRFAVAVLHEIDVRHAALHAVVGRARAALPVFAHDPSAGAPHLAVALAELADRLDHEPPADGRLATRGGSQLVPVLLPWVLEHATAEERAALLADASPRVRLLLRLGEDRYARLRELVSSQVVNRAPR